MLQGRDIICLASQPWASHWCTPQQIMSRLGRFNRVLYVEPLRSPLWLLKKNAVRPQESHPGLREISKNIWVYSPPPIFAPLQLYHRVQLLAAMNGFLASYLIRSAAKRIGFDNPIYWVFQVTYQGAPMLRDKDLVVYDCIDEWAGVAQTPKMKRYVNKIDRRLCAEADILFVGSRVLAATREGLNPVTKLVPQGVDLKSFLKASNPNLPLPHDMTSIPRPVMGLIGVLNKERLDIGLLHFLAKQRPEWSFVLVGPIWEGLNIELFKDTPNVYFLGNKPLDQLGDYLAAFDVCMLPYLINDFTRNIFPLKLFEYLASGKPFVSTPIPACAEFPNLIRTADSADAFLEQLTGALSESDPPLRAQRIALASQNDWDQRASDKSELVAEVLARAKSANRAPLRMADEKGI